jgi:hypothetical protein
MSSPLGAGVVVASQSGHRLGALTATEDAALAVTPADELLALSLLQPDQVKDSLHAYQLSTRGNALRVTAEAVRWGKRGARVNTISPGIIITPLAKDELTGPRGEGYRRMIDLCPVGRAGTPDEVGTVGALLMGPEGAFITGSDFLMDGGVTAAYRFGELAPMLAFCWCEYWPGPNEVSKLTWAAVEPGERLHTGKADAPDKADHVISDRELAGALIAVAPRALQRPEFAFSSSSECAGGGP